jgi:hypothetical protein
MGGPSLSAAVTQVGLKLNAEGTMTEALWLIDRLPPLLHNHAHLHDTLSLRTPIDGSSCGIVGLLSQVPASCSLKGVAALDLIPASRLKTSSNRHRGSILACFSLPKWPLFIKFASKVL